MTEQEILSYFKKYNLNIEDRPEFKTDKEMILEVAQKAIRLLGYAGEDLMEEADTVKKMFELELEERINNQT